MKHLPHYDHDERTRYDVRIVEYGAYFEEVEVHWVRGCLTLEEAQIKYAAKRDEICERIGAGASHVGSGQIFDERGQHLAYVSFNGRLWRVWTSEFLADFPRIDDYKEERGMSMNDLFYIQHLDEVDNLTWLVSAPDPQKALDIWVRDVIGDDEKFGKTLNEGAPLLPWGAEYVLVRKVTHNRDKEGCLSWSSKMDAGYAEIVGYVKMTA